MLCIFSLKKMNQLLAYANFVSIFSVFCHGQIQGRNKEPIATYRSDFPHEYTYGKSPFPALDGFIEFIASFENVSGC